MRLNGWEWAGMGGGGRGGGRIRGAKLRTKFQLGNFKVWLINIFLNKRGERESRIVEWRSRGRRGDPRRRGPDIRHSDAFTRGCPRIIRSYFLSGRGKVRMLALPRLPFLCVASTRELERPAAVGFRVSFRGRNEAGQEGKRVRRVSPVAKFFTVYKVRE